MKFVLDASMTLAWHFQDEDVERWRPIARAAFADGVVVPHHWFLEVASGLLRGERRQRTKFDQVDEFVATILDLDVEVDVSERSRTVAVLMPLARRLRLSVYDAAYLELANRRRLPLATLDVALAVAARSVGVDVIGTEEG